MGATDWSGSAAPSSRFLGPWLPQSPPEGEGPPVWWSGGLSGPTGVVDGSEWAEK